jgi:hypothetical protein
MTPFDTFCATLPEERQAPIQKLRSVFVENLPKGFSEEINKYGLNFVVPYSIYPKGYHCEPKQPLPFISIMSNKGAIAIYHMGIYADEKLTGWFQNEYPKHSKTKLDMGKSCIKFKKIDQIPYELIGELATKMSVETWIALYEKAFRKV